MWSVFTYIDPSNHPNVCKYASPMECLGTVQQINTCSSKLGTQLHVTGIALHCRVLHVGFDPSEACADIYSLAHTVPMSTTYGHVPDVLRA